MEKLKPCQLCWGEGKAKAEKKDHTGFSLWCECVKCYVRSGGCCPDLKNISNCADKAIKAWDRRANDDKHGKV